MRKSFFCSAHVTHQHPPLHHPQKTPLPKWDLVWTSVGWVSEKRWERVRVSIRFSSSIPLKVSERVIPPFWNPFRGSPLGWEPLIWNLCKKNLIWYHIRLCTNPIVQRTILNWYSKNFIIFHGYWISYCSHRHKSIWVCSHRKNSLHPIINYCEKLSVLC